MTFEIKGFTPIDVIGQGGFGVVHRAADDAHGREVAVKILGRIADDSARRRFDRERRAMGTLSGHPTIGIVYTSGFTANEEPYIVMEMIRGGSLANRLEQDGPLSASEVVGLGVTLAEALHHAHEGGVLHLDLKPENILMSRFGQPKIVDFGIAALVDDESATSTIRATPSFADPQVLDGNPGTEQSDVYGLAATLFTLLDGASPYSHGAGGMYQVMRRVALDPVPRVERDDVSDALADLLQGAMAKQAADRPQTMDEFARLLREVDAEPVTQRRASRRRVDRSSDSLPSTTPEPAAPSDASPRPPTPAGPSAGWPAGLGPRPPLPGAVAPIPPSRRPPGPAPSRAPAAGPTPSPTPAPTPTPTPARIDTPAAFAAAAASPGDSDRQPVVQEADTESGSRTNTLAIAVLSTLAVVLVAAIAFVVVRRNDTTTGQPEVTIARGDTAVPTTTEVDVEARATADGSVPDVVGLTIADAREVIDASGFDVAIPAHCFDTVASQSPAPGAMPVEDDVVMSLQFAPCVVPDFIGLRLTEARRIVEEEFVIGLLITWPTHCEDIVLDQSIAPGTVVDPGTEVDLVLEDDCSG